MKYRFMDLAGAGAFDTTMKGILRPVFPGHSSNIPWEADFCLALKLLDSTWFSKNTMLN